VISRLIGLKRERDEIRQRIVSRRHRMGALGEDFRRHGRSWAGTSNAKLQAFLAGFMLDQARPLLPGETSPVKLALFMLFRRLELLVRNEF
jgi:hypothetical protein